MLNRLKIGISALREAKVFRLKTEITGIQCVVIDIEQYT